MAQKHTRAFEGGSRYMHAEVPIVIFPCRAAEHRCRLFASIVAFAVVLSLVGRTRQILV